jgi:NAD+ synthase (glutamine-hydrolysing)
MKIALAQINPTVGDIDGNVRKIIEYGNEAKKRGAALVIFSELAVCGYPPQDLLLKESFLKANRAGLERICAELKDIACLVGFADINEGPGSRAFNACAFIEGGQVKSVQYKTLLPTYDVFDEDRYFEPAKEYAQAHLENWHIGLSICEDIWNFKELFQKARYDIDPIEKIAVGGCNLLINISASPFTAGKQHLRHELVRGQATRFGIPVIYVNQVGGNDELIFDGRSIVVDGTGQLIAQAKAFEEDLLVVELNSTGLEQAVQEIRPSPEDTTINIHQALVLGTRDYMRKCGFKKAVVGLSGGIDSAVTCAIAVQAVGAENVLGVAMPSPYSSNHSVDDSRRLAENLEIEFKLVPIEPAMKAYGEILKPTFADQPTNVAEENIQARIRGNILMAISNKFGHLVLTTGNKSELAVGYCTLYGDMCGGLAVISDVPKMMVYDLANYINEHANKTIIPISTIEKPPSAELRPNQLDQDTLPPYVILDGILFAYVEQRKSVEAIIRMGYKREVVADVINRIDHNEYKRYQAAPGLKVSSQSFGFGWRMPIAQKFKERQAFAPDKASC